MLGLFIVGLIHGREVQHYLYFNGGGGLNNLSYNLQDGTQKGRFGNTINVGYSFFFNKNFGVLTGVGFQNFGAISTINKQFKTPDVDSDGANYEFRANYANWKEKQNSLFVDIPLAFQFQQPITSRLALISSIGAKISFPLNTNYKTVGGEIVTTGYYSQWNVEYKNLPQHGFTTITDAYKGSLSFKTAYIGTADLGTIYAITERINLYFGGYFNYGINNILKPDSKLIYQPDGVYNGVLSSSQTNSVKPVSMGLKLGVYFQLGKVKSLKERKHILDSLRTKYRPDFTDKRIDQLTNNNFGFSNTTSIVGGGDDLKKIEAAEREELRRKRMNARKQKLRDMGFSVRTFFDQNGVEQIEATVPSDILFKFDSYELQDKGNSLLTKLYGVIEDIPNTTIKLTGYTDNIGKKEYNKELSQNRAVTVANVLVKMGTSKEAIQMEGKGDNSPVASNKKEEGRAKNRRVEIVFITPNI